MELEPRISFVDSEYSRLFVVDTNEAAIQLYIRNNFTGVDGACDAVFYDGLVLHEYGYEIRLSSKGILEYLTKYPY